MSRPTSCKGCVHCYREMTGKGGVGYNPAPYCHLYEDTGERPDPIFRKCYERRKKPNAI